MNITRKSVLKGLVVTTVAVIGLQGIAFAAASKPSAPTADGRYALVQDASNASKESKSAPIQVAARIPNDPQLNDPCRNIRDCD
ncbi:hypothetical protein ALP73_03134 [Pseudomonas coronafaciens pv. garcae]|nr:hypothetical protein ALQ62_200110 [Pseudomonas coronafaciens pv. zizaniae]RMS05079.1 hypothetical protein ALP73_03134 [Pseudomonas coronafaciens pv. garcae]RMV97345.1 hypothetical protein ALP00_01840 [Pseudomonas coronafaciens pv. porri]